MKNPLFYLLPFLLCYALPLHGQESERTKSQTYTMQERTNTTITTFAFTMDEGPAETKGEPYLYQEWLDGTLHFTDDTLAVQMRYHVLQDQLMFIHPYLRKKYVAKNESVNGFKWSVGGEEQEFVRLEQAHPEAETEGFYQVLRKGDYWVLRRHRKRLDKADHKDPFGSSRNYDKITDQPPVLFVLDTKKQELIRWNGSKSDWKNLIGKANWSQLEDYAEQQQLSLKEEADLPKLLDFVEQTL